MVYLSVHTNEEFDEAMKTPNKVVKYSAEWCGPCKRIQPIFEQMAQNNPQITFIHVDMDEVNAPIQSLPTFQFYRNGTLMYQFAGASSSSLHRSFTNVFG